MNTSTWRQRWRRTRHSLGARLVLLFLLFALAVTVTFLAGMQSALRSGWHDYAEPLVADYVDALAAQIGTPPDVNKARALAERLPLRIRIDGPVVNWSSHPNERHDEHRRFARPGRERQANPWRPVRVLADGHRISFGLALLRDDDSPEDQPRLIGWVTLAVLLVLTALAYLTVRRLLRPLNDIRAGALRYGSGDFSSPIPTRRGDELGDLAAQINGMADGLHHMLDAKRQLLLAISHELRSPLTRARLNAELVDESDARSALLRDLSDMRDLITDLLESERLSGGHKALQTEPTDLNALVRELVQAQFDERGITVALAADLPALELDPARIKLLLRNLLDNAERHGAGAATPPIVSTSRQDQGVLISVRDHGPGVTEAQAQQLGSAFYRTDAARARSTGGVGLGLYLCRLIAEAHGGTLSVRNATPGLEIEVRLPTS
ncbi:MAG: HAMP domain-containing sensor histidine kinase [Burkholderiaceae bacterium]